EGARRVTHPHTMTETPDTPQQPSPAAPPVPPAAPGAGLPEALRPDAEPAPVDTGSDRGDGLTKCPRCGATDEHPVIGTDQRQCAFCRYQWTAAACMESVGFDSPIHELRGTIHTTGVSDIDAEASNIVTIKCQGCGAEVVINTESQLQARCHWCRQVLSQQTQIANGAVPDAVLPFHLSHAQAVEQVRKFANRRRM